MKRTSAMTMAVVALAAHRATRVITTDSVSEPLRHRLWMWTMLDVSPEQRKRREWLAGDEDKGSDKVGLINCGHCTGFHLTYITLFAYTLACNRRWRWLQHLVEMWAIAGVQSILASGQVALDTIGHVDAEALTGSDDQVVVVDEAAT